jgi:hypothetical protein
MEVNFVHTELVSIQFFADPPTCLPLRLQGYSKDQEDDYFASAWEMLPLFMEKNSSSFS